MSKRNSGRRGRSRKRNRGAGRLAGEAEAAPAATAQASAPGSGRRAATAGAATAQAGRSRGARRSAEPRSGYRDPGGVGDRPEAPWHPWPLSELLILVGAIGTIVGFTTKAQALLFAALGSVVLGTLDFTIREHRSGYRSHTSLLAAVPTALLHGAVALLLNAGGVHGGLLVVLPLVVDVPVFWFLFRLLRARFEEARRERVFALKRR